MQFIYQKIRWLKFLILIPVFFSLSAFASTKTILILGDNLSTEADLEPGTGWVSLLEKKLTHQHPDYKVVNVSIAGETTTSGNEHFSRFIDKHHPEIVVIELGANDGGRHTPVMIVEKNIRTLVKTALNAGCKVLVLGISIPEKYGKDYAKQFPKIYERITNETNAELVPDFLNGINMKGIDNFNQIHFSKEAQFILLDNVWSHLLPLL